MKVRLDGDVVKQNILSFFRLDFPKSVLKADFQTSKDLSCKIIWNRLEVWTENPSLGSESYDLWHSANLVDKYSTVILGTDFSIRITNLWKILSYEQS